MVKEVRTYPHPESRELTPGHTFKYLTQIILQNHRYLISLFGHHLWHLSGAHFEKFARKANQ